MLRLHPTLAAFLATGLIVAITGYITNWHLWLLYILITLVGLFMLARLFAGLPLSWFDSGGADAEMGPVSPRSPLSSLRGNDMAGIGAEPDELSQAYDDWIAAKQGDALADGSMFKRLADQEKRDR